MFLFTRCKYVNSSGINCTAFNSGMRALHFGQFSSFFVYCLTCSLCRWDGRCVITICARESYPSKTGTHQFIIEEYGRSADRMIVLKWRQDVAQDRFSRRQFTCGFSRNREIYCPVGRPSASRGTLPLTLLYNCRYSN